MIKDQADLSKVVVPDSFVRQIVESTNGHEAKNNENKEVDKLSEELRSIKKELNEIKKILLESKQEKIQFIKENIQPKEQPREESQFKYRNLRR